LSLSCLLQGKTSLKAVPRLLQVVNGFYQLQQRPDPDDDFDFAFEQDGLEPCCTVPHWTTTRMWLMRLGLAQLGQEVVKAPDWVWFIDHSMQLGRERLLAVLGVRLSELPRETMRLRRRDMRLLHLAVMRDPNKETNHQELLKVMARTGPPRLLLNDHGADLQAGIRLFREGLDRPQRTLDVYEVTHKAALVLGHALEKDPRWQEFLAQVGRTRSQTQQTEWAFLLPPVLKSKSRYMNLGELLRWAEKTRWLVENKPAALMEHGDAGRLAEKMGWLSDYAGDLKKWGGWRAVTAKAEEVIREQGLHADTGENMRQAFWSQGRDKTGREMKVELLEYAHEQTKGLKEGERAPGSTQVLESCFGALKALEKQQSRSGFTGLVLGLGALVGKVTADVVARALESTPVKAVRRWCQENIGQSLQAKRCLASRLARATALA
jgi:hypothetical protein